MQVASRARTWPSVLALRPELIDQSGQLSDLQMSLFSAVYQTKTVPYREVAYYGEITEPTPRLVGFMADIARRLGTTTAVKALYHLDQGMGGGKSHALIGLYHLAKNPAGFFQTEIGRRVREEAQQRAGGAVDVNPARVVVLSADNMTPGKSSPEFGPATTLFERFLWALFDDHATYDQFVGQGADKAALQRAMATVGGPILILLDELMDYALALSDAAHVARMPGEQAFLNALMDAVDELPQVAFVVVMIRSDLDDRGYNEKAEAFRDYVTTRLERNGVTASVTEAPDFAAIIRRRIFQPPSGALALAPLVDAWKTGASNGWEKQVFNQLPSERGLVGFADRVAQTYPFHPDLMALVRDDWSPHAGFQRVRSTVEIFAIAAYYWQQQYQKQAWVPELIGVGDIPLPVTIEQVLSSGLLHGRDKAIQGFRQVAATDVISRDGTQGRAVVLDQRFVKEHPGLRLQPHPSVRMATALFLYSLVPRAQTKQGATKAELLASIFEPGTDLGYSEAEEVFNLLVSDDAGLGALEVLPGAGGIPTQYRLAVTHTLRMMFRQAKEMVDADRRDEDLWELVKSLYSKGSFDSAIPVERPRNPATPLGTVFEKVDETLKNRLVIFDPRRWTLLNGKDAATRADIEALFGLGNQGLRVDYAASCVIACANTQRWDNVKKRANDWQAHKIVVNQTLDPTGELYPQAQTDLKKAQSDVERDIRNAFQHFAYLIWTTDTGVTTQWRRLEKEGQTALSGNQVWDDLVEAHRAVRSGTLSGDYLKVLLDLNQRNFTLKEVVRKFWQDPAFPLVPTEQEVRRAIFETLRGDDRWEIVDGNGNPLTILSPDQLAINSMEHTVRKAVVPPPFVPPSGPGPGLIPPGGGSGGTPGPGPTPPGGGGTRPQAATYKRVVMDLRNRSVTDPVVRQRVFNLLSELADILDPTSGKDIQVVNFSLTITAADGSMADAEQKAHDAGVSWREEEEDF